MVLMLPTKSISNVHMAPGRGHNVGAGSPYTCIIALDVQPANRIFVHAIGDYDNLPFTCTAGGNCLLRIVTTMLYT